MTKPYKVIDLFSGCGGFSQGFLKAGFEVLAANEFWSPASETYKFNHKNVEVIEGDITLPQTKESLYMTVGNEKINVIIGGPPCQGYSIAGNRNPDDPRGQLYLDFIEVIDHLKPDFFVMENVKGLLNMKHIVPDLNENDIKTFKRNCEKLQRYKDLKRFSAQRKLDNDEQNEFSDLTINIEQINENINNKLIGLKDKILKKFDEIGYNVSWKVLNSVDYGVAQTRERIIFLGSKHKKISLKFPIKEDFYSSERRNENKKKQVTVRDVLKKYENWSENQEKTHVFTAHSEKFIEKIKNTGIGENVYKNYSDAWWRLDPDKPARTVKENHGGVFVHYKFDRVCTPRELAALQSFDDDFIFKGTKSAILKQIGNAVPPLMAKVIAENIKELLDKIY